MCITVNVLTLYYPKVAEASKGHLANTQEGIKFISNIPNLSKTTIVVFYIVDKCLLLVSIYIPICIRISIKGIINDIVTVAHDILRIRSGILSIACSVIIIVIVIFVTIVFISYFVVF